MARLGTSARAAPGPRLELLDVGLLRSHEQVQPGLLEQTIDQIKRDGYVKRPILVADRYFVILDGHHRFEALRALGCRRIPAYVVDYFSDVVDLTLWPEATVKEITKGEVIRRGLAGELFPPKTTRHILRVPLGDSFIDLEDLL